VRKVEARQTGPSQPARISRTKKHSLFIILAIRRRNGTHDAFNILRKTNDAYIPWRSTMSIKDSAHVLFEITHPDQSDVFCALREYLENMYFG